MKRDIDITEPEIYGSTDLEFESEAQFEFDKTEQDTQFQLGDFEDFRIAKAKAHLLEIEGLKESLRTGPRTGFRTSFRTTSFARTYHTFPDRFKPPVRGNNKGVCELKALRHRVTRTMLVGAILWVIAILGAIML